MKKAMIAITMTFALAGCDDATKMIDQAQQAANSAVDTMQAQVESFEIEGLSLAQFGSAAQSAEELTASFEELMSLDVTDSQAITQATDTFANAYRCLVEATSVSSADQLLNTIMSSVGSAQAQSLLEQGLAKAQQAQTCVS